MKNLFLCLSLMACGDNIVAVEGPDAGVKWNPDPAGGGDFQIPEPPPLSSGDAGVPPEADPAPDSCVCLPPHGLHLGKGGRWVCEPS